MVRAGGEGGRGGVAPVGGEIGLGGSGSGRGGAFDGSRLITLLSSLGFFAIFSSTMSKSPVLPLFARSMGAGTDLIGLVAAISPIAGIVLSFPVGLLADRMGKKRLLVVAASVFATAPLLYLVAPNPLWLIPIRFFHGVATAILGPVSSAMILSEYRGSKGEKLGIYSSATLVGRSLAPLAGGALMTLFATLQGGWNFRVVYIGTFLLALPVFALSLAMPRDRGGTIGVEKMSIGVFVASLVSFLGNRRLAATALVEAATYFVYGAFETYLPLFLQASGLPIYQIGLIFSLQILAMALSKPLFGKLSDNIDRRLQVLSGIVALGAAFALIPLAGGIAAATLVGIVFGLGLSFSTVATNTYVSDVADEERLGASMGALSSIMDIGHSTGPFVIGLIVASAGMRIGFFAGFAVCLVSAIVFATLAFGKRP
ncbi:MAG TPA: MFS transporter [Rectinemataceae bacterium]|nr:MFS transporter [Rectinemataceae bacterium]